MPLPASTTTFSGRMEERSTSLRRYSCVGLEDVPSRSRCRPSTEGISLASRYFCAWSRDAKQTGFGGHRNGAGLWPSSPPVVFGRLCQVKVTPAAFSAPCKSKELSVEMNRSPAFAPQFTGKMVFQQIREEGHIAA